MLKIQILFFIIYQLSVVLQFIISSFKIFIHLLECFTVSNFDYLVFELAVFVKGVLCINVSIFNKILIIIESFFKNVFFEHNFY